MKTKYRVLKGFKTKQKAEKFLEAIQERNKGLTYQITKRKWADKDKTRFYVRELTRKGEKR